MTACSMPIARFTAHCVACITSSTGKSDQIRIQNREIFAALCDFALKKALRAGADHTKMVGLAKLHGYATISLSD